MHRLTAVVCALCLILISGVRADEKDKKSPSADSLFNELATKYQGEESADGKRKVVAAYAQKFVDYATENPKAEDAPRALANVIRLGQLGLKISPELRTKALDTLRQSHVKSPHLAKIVKRFQIFPDDAAAYAFIKAVGEENPDKRTRALAVNVALKSRKELLEIARQLEDEKVRAATEKGRGKESVKAVLDQAKAAEGEIKKLQAKLDGELKGLVPEITVGKPAPEVVSENLEGKKVKLSDLRGKVVVLDVWATWCGPCRRMIPHTRELVEKYKDKPFVFVSVSADEEKATVQEFVKKNKMPWTHWWTGQEGMVEDWDITAFPSIFVIDAKGILREVIQGADTAALDAAVEKAIKDLGGK